MCALHRISCVSRLFHMSRQVCELAMQKHQEYPKGEMHFESTRKSSKPCCTLEAKLGLGSFKVLDKNSNHRENVRYSLLRMDRTSVQIEEKYAIDAEAGLVLVQNCIAAFVMCFHLNSSVLEHLALTVLTANFPIILFPSKWPSIVKS